IAVAGILANVINIMVFTKQGFKDNVNLSLFCLAIADFCSLLTLIVTCVLSHPRFLGTGNNFVGIEVQFLVACWPHVCFTKMTGWITAFIMFERCMCVALPLTVKTVLTKARVQFCLVTIYVCVIAGVIPTYATHSLGWKFYPGFNRTLLGLQFDDWAIEVTYVSNLLNIPVSSISSFSLTFVCTVVISFLLVKKRKWRKANGCLPNKASHQMSGNDHRAVKMVTVVSVIFLVSVTPSIAIIIGTVLFIEFSLTGKYRRLFYMCYCVSFVLEAINSSVNILVYYNMNVRF
ncbi:unnamed protein product, partial [Lymnaea stagnalis]